VLDILAEEDLAGRAARLGERFIDGLKALQAMHEFVGDVRGKGLMVGVEIVKTREGREPDAARTKKIQSAMKARGFIVGTTGNAGNVIRMTPPLVIQEAELDSALQAFGEAFAEA
jgi:2,2-dialkylglycine decarboxylase (pyruvate)